MSSCYAGEITHRPSNPKKQTTGRPEHLGVVSKNIIIEHPFMTPVGHAGAEIFVFLDTTPTAARDPNGGALERGQRGCCWSLGRYPVGFARHAAYWVRIGKAAQHLASVSRPAAVVVSSCSVNDRKSALTDATFSIVTLGKAE